MKRISLTSDEIDSVENVIIHYGNVVTFDQLSSFFDEDRQYTRVRIKKLVDQGWLNRRNHVLVGSSHHPQGGSRVPMSIG